MISEDSINEPARPYFKSGDSAANVGESAPKPTNWNVAGIGESPAAVCDAACKDAGVGPDDPTTFVEEAMKIVRGNREGVYGKPTTNFETIAKLWSAFLSVRADKRTEGGGITITSLDVAHLMILMKMGRLAKAPTHRDSHVDTVGYIDCAEQIIKEIA